LSNKICSTTERVLREGLMGHKSQSRMGEKWGQTFNYVRVYKFTSFTYYSWYLWCHCWYSTL